MLAFLIVPNFPIGNNLVLWAIPCYACGLIFHKIVEEITNPILRNRICMINRAYNMVEYEKKQVSDIKHGYYRAYYYLMKDGCMGYVPVLEAQVAFLRNLWCVLILYFFSFFLGIGEARNIIKTESGNIYLQCMVLLLFFFIIIIYLVYFFDWNNGENKHFRKYSLCLLIITSIAFLLAISIYLINICHFKLELHPLTCLCDYNYYSKEEINIHNVQLCEVGCLLLIGLIPFLLYNTQMKIHELVWEGFFYIKELNNN